MPKIVALIHEAKDDQDNVYPKAYTRIAALQITFRAAVVQTATWRDEAAFAGGKLALGPNGQHQFQDADPQDNGDGTFSYRVQSFMDAFGADAVLAAGGDIFTAGYTALLSLDEFKGAVAAG